MLRQSECSPCLAVMIPAGKCVLNCPDIPAICDTGGPAYAGSPVRWIAYNSRWLPKLSTGSSSARAQAQDFTDFVMISPRWCAQGSFLCSTGRATQVPSSRLMKVDAFDPRSPVNLTNRNIQNHWPTCSNQSPLEFDAAGERYGGCQPRKAKQVRRTQNRCVRRCRSGVMECRKS